MSHIALLDHLHEPQPVQLRVPLKDGGTAHYSATAQLRDQEDRTVNVELDQASIPPIEDIDFRSRCTITLDSKNGPTLSMYAPLEEILGEHRILVKGSDYLAYEPKRSSFRVEAEIPVLYRRFYREQESFRRAQSEDMSPKGIRILTNEELRSGDILSMSLEIPRPKQGVVLCPAEVRWVIYRHGGNRAIGCKFLDMDEASEDLLIAFCFQRQRELLKERVETADR